MNKKYIFIGVTVIAVVILFLVIVPKKPKTNGNGSGSIIQPDIINTEFSNERVVTILDYDDHAMEPFISRDKQYLFWNNRNEPSENTNLHWATRMDDLTYQYQGEIQGTNNEGFLEAVATLGENGRFYYTTNKDAPSIKSAIRSGDFNNGVVTNIQTELANALSNEFAMGPEISPDGNTLYLVRSIFGSSGPTSMNLLVAHLEHGNFVIDEDSNKIMKNINTDELEYAPAISDNGLELFFNRAKGIVGGVGTPDLGIYIAKRNSINEPFGIPQRIDAIQGFVEGATIADNGNSVYYHKMDKSKFKIFRVTRE